LDRQFVTWRHILALAFALCCLLSSGHARKIARAEALAPNSDEEIVYFDPNHVIRVFDPNPTSEVLQVEWSSPDGGWGAIALGDVTGDGDLEIVAIRPEGETGRLTIFDPVAQDSLPELVEDADEIPWAILYDLELPLAPRLVATGEFDTQRAGREILYSYAVDDEHDRFVILRATGEGGPGRGWEEQLSWELEGRWSAVATGNVHVDDAIDEVALVSFDLGELALFRVEPDVVRTFTNVNRDHRWRDVAIGQYVIVDNDGAEIAAVRDADFPLASAWVFRYNGSTFVDQLGERISPSPNRVFFADIRNNGDEEMVMLRQAQQELGPRPRLIVRDGNSNDAVTMQEALLDGDNEYRGGDAGDIDGDGRDELVVIRNNRIRIYPEPEASATFDLYELFTNGSTVAVGNVDAAGFAPQSRVLVSPTRVSAILQPGERGSSVQIEIEDITRGANLNFAVNVLGAQSWTELEVADNVTPATFSVRLNAEGVDPGTYMGQLVIDLEAQNVENDPLIVALELVVHPVIRVSPSFVLFSCKDSSGQELRVALSADEAQEYSAQIEGNPAWLTVVPEAGLLPEEVVVRYDPAQKPVDAPNSNLLVTVDLPDEPGIVHRIPIIAACPHELQFLPILHKR
jgi:hypothetical protein